MRIFPFTTYDPPDDQGGGGGPAPWASDLEATFTDEAVRGQVDSYLREKWQPHVTKLEQDLAARPANVPPEAIQFINDLAVDPNATVSQLIEELYNDPDFAELYNPAVAEGWKGLLTPKQEAKVEAATNEEGEIELAKLPKAVRDIVERELANEQKTTYETQVNAAIAAYPKTEDGKDVLSKDDYDYLHPFIQNSQGNLELAFSAYIAYRDALRGGATQQEATQEAVTAVEEGKQTPPNTLGGNGSGGNGTPPTAKTYDWNHLGDAVHDWIDEIKQGPPSTVGSV